MDDNHTCKRVFLFIKSFPLPPFYTSKCMPFPKSFTKLHFLERWSRKSFKICLCGRWLVFMVNLGYYLAMPESRTSHHTIRVLAVVANDKQVSFFPLSRLTWTWIWFLHLSSRWTRSCSAMVVCITSTLCPCKPQSAAQAVSHNPPFKSTF